MTVSEAEDLAIRGAHDDALRLLEPILSDGNHASFVPALRVAATIHAHRGMLARSADFYALIGGGGLGNDAGAAAVAMLGVGNVGGAQRQLRADDAPVPSAAATAWRLTAQGLQQTLVGDGVPGMATLMQSVTAMTPATRSPS